MPGRAVGDAFWGQASPVIMLKRAPASTTPNRPPPHVLGVLLLAGQEKAQLCACTRLLVVANGFAAGICNFFFVHALVSAPPHPHPLPSHSRLHLLARATPPRTKQPSNHKPPTDPAQFPDSRQSVGPASVRGCRLCRTRAANFGQLTVDAGCLGRSLAMHVHGEQGKEGDPKGHLAWMLL